MRDMESEDKMGFWPLKGKKKNNNIKKKKDVDVSWIVQYSGRSLFGWNGMEWILRVRIGVYITFEGG